MYDSISKILGTLITITAIGLACYKQDFIEYKPIEKKQKETQFNESWTQLNCGLWHQNSKIAFLSIHLNKYNKEDSTFITHIGTNTSLLLSFVIDTNSFQYLGGNIFKDINNIYEHNNTEASGRLNIIDTNQNSFKLLREIKIQDQEENYFFAKIE